MRINYCPDCDKAGLRDRDTDRKDDLGLTSQESYDKLQRGEKYIPDGYVRRRWCPRCLKWVVAINRPYTGSMHRK